MRQDELTLLINSRQSRLSHKDKENLGNKRRKFGLVAGVGFEPTTFRL